MWKTIFKLPKWCVGMIFLPAIFSFIISNDMIQIRVAESGWGGQESYRYDTPGFLYLLAFAAGLLAVYGIIQLFITYISMVEIQSKVNKQQKVVEAYTDQLELMRGEARGIITETKSGEMVGQSFPAAALVEQIGEIRTKVAKAKAVIAKAEVDLEEWLLGPLRGQAAYFYSVVEARKISIEIQRKD